MSTGRWSGKAFVFGLPPFLKGGSPKTKALSLDPPDDGVFGWFDVSAIFRFLQLICLFGCLSYDTVIAMVASHHLLLLFASCWTGDGVQFRSVVVWGFGFKP